MIGLSWLSCKPPITRMILPCPAYDGWNLACLGWLVYHGSRVSHWLPWWSKVGLVQSLSAMIDNEYRVLFVPRLLELTSCCHVLTWSKWCLVSRSMMFKIRPMSLSMIIIRTGQLTYWVMIVLHTHSMMLTINTWWLGWSLCHAQPNSYIDVLILLGVILMVVIALGNGIGEDNIILLRP